MTAPVLAPAAGALPSSFSLDDAVGALAGGLGMVPDFSGLLEPIARLIPEPLQAGVSAVLDSGVANLCGELIRAVGSAVFGEAGGAMVAKLTEGSAAVGAIDNVKRALDAIAGRAQQAVMAAIGDLGSIARQALGEIGAVANPVRLLSPAGPMVLAEAQAVALKHLGRAEARVRALGKELLGLASEATSTAVPAEAIPASPAGSGAQAPGSAPAAASPEPPAPAGGGAEAPAAGDDAVAGAPTEAAAKAVAAAKTQLGTPYVWGGTTPGEGFDCSGFVQWAYGQAGIDLPRLADQQAVGPQIPMDEVQPGDLAVWDGHVAMVIEDGQLIEAGDPVGISPIRTDNIGMNFYGFYRPTG